MAVMENTHCRYKGYRLYIDSISEGIAHVSSGDYLVCKMLNMQQYDRGHYIMEIPLTDLDAIWTFTGKSYDYDSISIIKGELFVKGCTMLDDPNNSDINIKGEFAKYNDKIYRSDDSVNHNSYFRLISYDKKSQEQGFIMEKPGIFIKEVPQEKIDFAFNAETFCMFKNQIYRVLDSKDNLQIKVVIDFNKLRPEKLNPKGYFGDLIKEGESKWIKYFETKSIWVETSPVIYFDRFESRNQILKPNYLSFISRIFRK